MSKRAVIVISLLVAFLLLGFGYPLLKIYIDVQTGTSVQASLLVSLRERFPTVVFKKFGAHGPSAHIWVIGPIDPATKLEIRRFLEAEKGKYGVTIRLFFMADENIADFDEVKI